MADNSSLTFDDISLHYEDLLEDPIKVWFGGDSYEYYLRVKATEILKHLHRVGVDSKTLRALDVGCGTGRMAHILHGEFLEIQGVDSSEGMIWRARKSAVPGVTFQVADARSLPFESNHFDFVYSSCLFHHVPQQFHAQVLREMVRVLKSSGWLFNFEHNALNPLTRLVVRRCPLDNGTKLLYSHQLTSICREMKLSQLHKRFILFLPKYLKALGNLERYFFWLPLGGQFYVCGRK